MGKRKATRRKDAPQPIDPAAVCQVLLAVEPVLADEAAIRRALGDVTVGTMPEVAALFGASPQTVQQGWRQGGMPGESGKWNAAEIAIWHIRRRLRQAAARRGSPSDENDPLKELEFREQLAIVRLREIKLAKEESSVIDRHAAQADVATVLSVLRESLLAVPRSLLPYFPAEQADEIAGEVRRAITHSLTAAAEKLVKRFGDDAGENESAPVPSESATDGEEATSKTKPAKRRSRKSKADTQQS